ncbi:tetratricopeptide repeat protein [Geomesophilobacter sediminis]|uniref:Tetratricopeptide repeat protein n=1 Tax=Geomesophilobacter sediminis TaxID=2798584 RepID=A0A8J7J116_9BACT|nr:tetratricopeptide repeat protein [Geomesophilobacter sediminis]MBJ6724243.1 tetratricopeptide repeat protein [Geomesophilobacter sediminis]
MYRLSRLFSLLLLMFLLAACSGPEAKKQKFFAKGKELYEKGEYVNARLELKNALQIDPKFSGAHYLSGMIALREGDLKGAYGYFSKAVELDPANKDAQYQIGKIFLGARLLDKAQEKDDLILKQDPNYRDALLLKGALMVARKENDAACRYLEELIGRGIKTPDTYLLLATAHAEKGDSAGADAAVARGLEANPNAVEVNLAQAGILARQNKPEQVAAVLAKVCQLEPKNLNHPLNLARFHWDAGKVAEATRVLDGIVAADPVSEERRLKVALFYGQHQRPDDAEKTLKEGIAKSPKSFNLRFALSEFYLNGPHPERGIAVLKEALSADKESSPGVVEAKTALAKVYLQQGDLAQASGYVEQVLKESPKNVEARFLKGSICLQRKEAGTAVAEFRTVVSDKPQFLPGYLRLAEANLMNKAPGLALDNLRSAEKIAPGSREVQIAFAKFHTIQKDYPAAKEVLEKLVAKEPRDVEARVLLGDALVLSGNEKGGEAAYQEVIRKAPSIAIGYVKSAALHLKQGKRERAVAEYEKAVQLNPGSWLVANDLAYLYATTGRDGKDLERALQLAEKARSLNPAGVSVLDTLGWIYYRKGEAGKAVELLQQVVAKNPAPEISYHLGMALIKTGKTAEAKQQLAKSLAGTAPFPWRAEATRALASI